MLEEREVRNRGSGLLQILETKIESQEITQHVYNKLIIRVDD